jgi:toxin HigB-1
MIRTFKSADLKELHETGSARRIDTKLAQRARERLTVLNAARDLRALNIPSWELHKWKGYTTKYSVSVSGPWRITFTWKDGDAYDVDLENPHG